MNKPVFVSSKIISELTGIPVWSIQKMTREKKIPAYSLNGKSYLYKPEEVISIIEKNKTI